MLDIDPRLTRAIAPHLERVLVVDPVPASARLLIELVQNIRRGQVWTAGATSAGLSLAQSIEPQLIFVEASGDQLDGLAFTRTLRRSELSCRKAPVIMVTAQATPATILGARDAGVHEFLRKPFTNKDLIRRIEAVCLHSRGWIEAVGYVGPDRRRFNSADYKGPKKRRIDAETTEEPARARVDQALRIVASALGAMESNPAQAQRALAAQADDLRRAGMELRDSALTSAAAGLQAYLAEVGRGASFTRKAVETLTAPLLALKAAEPEDRARSAA